MGPLRVLCAIAAFITICATQNGQNIPKWALERNSQYLPAFTTFANKSELYVRPCLSSNCNSNGDCFELSDGERVCECRVGKFGPKCEFDDLCWLHERKDRGFCENGGTCTMELTNEGATPVCDCPHDSFGPRCEKWTECENPTCVAEHTDRCFQLHDGSHKCVCHGNGFGPRCEFIAEAGSTCADMQCQHGTCDYEVESRKPKCSCSEGFEGDDCSQPIDVCRSSPCAHGTCVTESPAQWRCECERGWEGLLCDEPFSPCSTHDCVNGTCYLGREPPQTCKCDEGYEGERCSQKVGTDCRMRPCEHGGVCSENPDGSVGCSCPHNWYGDFCEYDTDECAFFSLEEAICRNGGSCSNLAGGFLCDCMTGFTGDFCQTDADDCSPDPCINGGTCVDAGPMKYECQCPMDEETGEHLFYGTHCEIPNICYPSTGPDAKCKNDGICLLSSDFLSFTCDCINTGWTGATCELDVDECEDDLGQFLCRERGHRCVNTPGSFHCECKNELYYGEFCLDKDDICEAANPCKHNSTCVSLYEDSAQLEECICPPGFDGDLCELDLRCSSIECMDGTICFEDDRGVGSCHCPPNKVCGAEVEGLNECRSRGCFNGQCQQVTGKWQCVCAMGYTGPKCDHAIDDCQSHPCKNGAECIDGASSYYCDCAAGFFGPQCQFEVDECELLAGPEGNKLHGDCLNGGLCVDGLNSTACQCPEEYTGLKCETLIDPCNDTLCHKDVAKCVRLSHYSFECQCKPGWTGPDCTEYINPCFPNPCGEGGRCVMGRGERIPTDHLPIWEIRRLGDRYDLVYHCECPVGKTGVHCNETVKECPDNHCLNGGTCAVNEDGLSCDCPTNTRGGRCEYFLGAHGRGLSCDQLSKIRGAEADKLCGFPNGRCEDDEEGMYRCKCEAGFLGHHCEQMTDICSQTPGICNFGNCVNKPNDFQCECLEGYEGKICEKKIDYCLPNNPCPGYDGMSRCLPMPGFTGATHLCVRPSIPQFVKGHGSECGYEYREQCGDQFVQPDTSECMMTNGARRCLNCPEGYFGQQACEARINMCSSNLSKCYPPNTLDCVQNFTLVEDDSRALALRRPAKKGRVDVRCICKVGFGGDDCSQPLDTCDPNPCQNGGICTALPAGDYQCKCPTLYGGKNCSFVNTCDDMDDFGNYLRCSGSGRCVMIGEGLRKCECNPGVSGPWCTKDTRDECSLYDPCPIGLNCTDMLGYYRCVTEHRDKVVKPEAREQEDQWWTAVLGGGVVVVLVLIVMAVVIPKATRVLVTKTWFPTGLAEKMIKKVRKRGREEAEGKDIELQYYEETEYEYEQVAKRSRKENEVPLMNCSVNSQTAGTDNITPAMLALRNNNMQTLELIAKKGYSMNEQTHSRRESVMHMAVLQGCEEAVKIILNGGHIDLTLCDHLNRNCLMAAAAAGNPNIVEALLPRLNREAINQKQNDGSTALMSAVRGHYNAVVRKLLEYNADVHLSDNRGRSALHWAAQVDNVEAIFLLVQYKADRNAQDSEDSTPLMHAVKEGNYESTRKLLELGVDRQILNRDQRTALDIAQYYNLSKIAELFEMIVAPYFADVDNQQKRPNSRKVKTASKRKQPKRKDEMQDVYMKMMNGYPPNFVMSPSGHILSPQNACAPLACVPPGGSNPVLTTRQHSPQHLTSPLALPPQLHSPATAAVGQSPQGWSPGQGSPFQGTHSPPAGFVPQTSQPSQPKLNPVVNFTSQTHFAPETSSNPHADRLSLASDDDWTSCIKKIGSNSHLYPQLENNNGRLYEPVNYDYVPDAKNIKVENCDPYPDQKQPIMNCAQNVQFHPQVPARQCSYLSTNYNLLSSNDTLPGGGFQHSPSMASFGFPHSVSENQGFYYDNPMYNHMQRVPSNLAGAQNFAYSTPRVVYFRAESAPEPAVAHF